MKRSSRSLQYVLLLLTTVLLYVLLFVALPGLFPRYYPTSNEASAFLLIFPLLFSSAGVLLFSLKLWHWLSADLLLGLLMLLYNGKGHYGIGLRGVRLDGACPKYDVSMAAWTVAGLLILLLLVQCLSLLLKKWIQWYKA